MDDETKQWLDNFEQSKLSMFDKDLMYGKDSPEEHEYKVMMIEKLCQLVKKCAESNKRN